MAGDLTGVWEKVYQAHRHVEELNATLEGIYKDAGASIRLDRDPDTGEDVAILPTIPLLPGRLSAVIGDVLQNLRNALDHLAYQFVLHPKIDPGGSKTAEDRIQFPIYVDEASYSDRRIIGADERAKAIVKALQPFGNEDHPRWLLHELSNIDKHRTLLVVAHELQAGVFDRSVFDSLTLLPPGPAVDNAQLARFRVRSGAKRDMDMNLHVSFGLRFEEPVAQGRSVTGFLDQAVTSVRHAIGALQDFIDLA